MTTNIEDKPQSQVVLPQWQCVRFCGHKWVGRSAIRPTFCPGCGQRNWYIPPSEKPLRHRGGVLKRMYGTVEFADAIHQGHSKDCDCESPVVLKSPNAWWHLQEELEEGDYLEITVRRGTGAGH